MTRIVSHLPYPVWVQRADLTIYEVERAPEIARIALHHHAAGGLVVDDGAPIRLRTTEWSGVQLPPPVPGVSRVVTVHMAELAVLSGRPHDDLLVALQAAPAGPDGRRAYKALCPAAHASPALRALLCEHTHERAPCIYPQGG